MELVVLPVMMWRVVFKVRLSDFLIAVSLGLVFCLCEAAVRAFAISGLSVLMLLVLDSNNASICGVAVIELLQVLLKFG